METSNFDRLDVHGVHWVLVPKGTPTVVVNYSDECADCLDRDFDFDDSAYDDDCECDLCNDEDAEVVCEYPDCECGDDECRAG